MNIPAPDDTTYAFYKDRSSTDVPADDTTVNHGIRTAPGSVEDFHQNATFALLPEQTVEDVYEGQR